MFYAQSTLTYICPNLISRYFVCTFEMEPSVRQENQQKSDDILHFCLEIHGKGNKESPRYQSQGTWVILITLTLIMLHAEVSFENKHASMFPVFTICSEGFYICSVINIKTSCDDLYHGQYCKINKNLLKSLNQWKL